MQWSLTAAEWTDVCPWAQIRMQLHSTRVKYIHKHIFCLIDGHLWTWGWRKTLNIRYVRYLCFTVHYCFTSTCMPSAVGLVRSVGLVRNESCNLSHRIILQTKDQRCFSTKCKIVFTDCCWFSHPSLRVLIHTHSQRLLSSLSLFTFQMFINCLEELVKPKWAGERGSILAKA